MRSRTLLFVLAASALLLAAGALILWPRSQTSRVTRENFARIQQGMSRHDVEAILGPPGDYRTGQTALILPLNSHGGFNGRLTPAQIAYDAETADLFPGFFDDGCTFELWQCDDAVIWICYDKDGVSMWDFAPIVRVRGGLLADICWQLERMWHRWVPK
jgi:hypothetical protein